MWMEVKTTHHNEIFSLFQTPTCSHLFKIRCQSRDDFVCACLGLFSWMWMCCICLPMCIRFYVCVCVCSVRASIHNRLPGRYKYLLRFYLGDSSPFPLSLSLSAVGIKVHVIVCVHCCYGCIGKRGDRISICCPFKKRSVSICHGMMPTLCCRRPDSGTWGLGRLKALSDK